MKWLMTALATLLNAPFRLEISPIHPNDLPSQEHYRRFAVLRLLLVSLTVLEVGIALPVAVISHVPLPALIGQIGGALFGLVCLWIAQRGAVTVSGILFVDSAIVGLFLGTALDPSVSPLRATLAYSIQVVFILLAGLLLPLPFLGWVVSFIWGLLALCLWVIAPHLLTASDRFVVFGFLTVIYAGCTLLTWVAARSTRSGLQAISLALLREQEVTQLKDLFIMDINHELRTPIMALITNYEILTALKDTSPSALRQRVVQRGLQAGQNLMALLEGILDTTTLAGLQPTDDSLQIFDLVPLIQETLTLLAEQTTPPDPEVSLAPREVHLHLPTTQLVRADVARVQQILRNLMTNALKYTPATSPITISIRMLTPTLVECIVQDKGPGIPPHEATVVFERFVRLERDIAGPVRGTGIGLYICRCLCESMGGTIWVESTGIPGAGAAFHFTLPISTEMRASKLIYAKN